MEIKELRIGNWVNYYVGTQTGRIIGMRISEISCTSDIAVSIEPPNVTGYTKTDFSDLSPVELTNEWLIKLGFEKWKDRLTIEAWAKGHPSQRFDIDFLNGEIIMNSRYQEHSDSMVMEHIKHVHQLQNLYFALTGEELKNKNS